MPLRIEYFDMTDEKIEWLRDQYPTYSRLLNRIENYKKLNFNLNEIKARYKSLKDQYVYQGLNRRDLFSGPNKVPLYYEYAPDYNVETLDELDKNFPYCECDDYNFMLLVKAYIYYKRRKYDNN